MKDENIFVSALSTSRHSFQSYHFCRGNSNKRKSRLGVILQGSGTYIYLGRRLAVKAGDVVFIPENIYCYSEWHGTPDIEVIYVSCFIHHGDVGYEPQIIHCDGEVKQELLHIAALLQADRMACLEAYALFYRVLQKILPQMQPADAPQDKTLQNAIAYITDHWSEISAVEEIAKHCHVSESHLYHLFQSELGETPIRFLNSIKINVAISHLEKREYSVAAISRLAGFSSENHFRRIFADFTGTTPLKYRRSRT
jgi:AraC-like DNA-binding protein